MTKQGNSGSNGVDPRAYFSSLENTFEVMPVRVAFFAPAGSTVTVVKRFLPKEITVQSDAWVIDGEALVSGPRLVDTLDGLETVPLGSIRKQTLPENVVCHRIRKGATYSTNMKIPATAPRDGRIIFVAASEMPVLSSASGSNGASGPGRKRRPVRDLFSAAFIGLLKSAGARFVDGYAYLPEELYQLYFGEKTPSGLVLVRNGEPFRAAALEEDVTFAFVNEGDSLVKAGKLVYENDNDVDGISTGHPLTFIRRHVPLV